MRRAGKGGRLQANRRGRRAERIAALWLMLRGYRILDRGFKVAGGEIDLVARRGETLAFVEVKRRASLDEALLAVTGTKRGRIARAAGVWLSRNAWAAGLTYRGDAVLIAPRRWPRHLADAFPVVIGY